MYDVALRREDLTRLLFDIAFIANGIFESRAIELLQLELRGEGSTVGGDVRGSTRVLLVSRSYRRSTGRPSFATMSINKTGGIFISTGIVPQYSGVQIMNERRDTMCVSLLERYITHRRKTQ
jgi:hypothetical protein